MHIAETIFAVIAGGTALLLVLWLIGRPPTWVSSLLAGGTADKLSCTARNGEKRAGMDELVVLGVAFALGVMTEATADWLYEKAGVNAQDAAKVLVSDKRLTPIGREFQRRIGSDPEFFKSIAGVTDLKDHGFQEPLLDVRALPESKEPGGMEPDETITAPNLPDFGKWLGAAPQSNDALAKGTGRCLSLYYLAKNWGFCSSNQHSVLDWKTREVNFLRAMAILLTLGAAGGLARALTLRCVLTLKVTALVMASAALALAAYTHERHDYLQTILGSFVSAFGHGSP